jgi:hypothetical protein
MQTVNYDHYALRRDVATIAKFINRMVQHREKLALWQLDSNLHKFPSPPSKDSKWPAYEAASRIERTLNLTTHAGSVPELASLLGEALKVTI